MLKMEQLAQKLQTISEQFPLTARWSPIEMMTEKLQSGSTSIQLLGLMCTDKGNEQVAAIGSAAEGNVNNEADWPIERAYFEMLERSIILEAKEASESFRVFPSEKKITATELFPRSNRPEQWQFSLSNGVALQKNFQLAAASAKLELIERDRLLRSWFGEFTPQRVWPLVVLPTLEGYHPMEVYSFHNPQDPTGEQVIVCAVCAFPLSVNEGTSAGWFVGFGAGHNLSLAVTHAWREGLQRWGFLQGESLGEAPAFSPTTDFHLDYFMRPQGVQQVISWLRGDGPDGKLRKLGTRAFFNLPLLANEEFSFADITPTAMKNKICVLKAISKMRVPLFMGHPPNFLRLRDLLPANSFHPIS